MPGQQGLRLIIDGGQESEIEDVRESEPDPVEQVERLKALNWKNVAPGTYLAKYLPPVEGLDRSKLAVETRRQQMLNPDFAKKLRRDIEGLKQNIRGWQDNLSWACEEAAKSWYYSKIMKAQHSLELKKDYLLRVEDKCYHLL